jgi:hypothetical protein
MRHRHVPRVGGAPGGMRVHALPLRGGLVRLHGVATDAPRAPRCRTLVACRRAPGLRDGHPAHRAHGGLGAAGAPPPVHAVRARGWQHSLLDRLGDR